MNEDIDIVKSFDELKLGDYLDIIYIAGQEALDEVDRQVKIISILTSRSEADILDLPINTYKSLAGEIGFLSEPLPEPDIKAPDSYDFGDMVLEPVKDFKKLTTAQYIDFQSLHKAGLEEHFAEILSCLLVPKGMKYCQGYEISDVHKAIKENMSVTEALSLYAFFLTSSVASMAAILTSSLEMTETIQDPQKKETIQKLIQEQLTTLQNAGGGLRM